MAYSVTQRKQLLSLSQRLLGRRIISRIRESSFRLTHQIKGFPHLRTDVLTQVDDHSLLINCRLLDPRDQVQHISLCYADGNTQCIDKALVHYRTSATSLSKTVLRPQAADRFAGLVTCTKNPSQITGIALTLTSGKRRLLKTRVTPNVSDPMTTIRKLLELVPAENDDKRRIFDHSYGSMIGALWNARTETATHEELTHYNKSAAKASPDVSLIIPIYGRYDFIEYQLAQFANDPDMRSHEILYVIDDPRLNNEIRMSCDTLSRLYPIAFNVLYLNANLGYAGANNAGIRHCISPVILLLNSDVFPTRTGWLRQMLICAGGQIDQMILGARLLYEDETVQHDGMEFHASPFASHLWTNLHPGKGLPADQFSTTSQPSARECVTGACMMISKNSYDAIGGLNENYILGDFEDSDLCMRAREHGLSIALAEHVALYHLERQSQNLVSSNRWKAELTYYNCWYHTQQWDAHIHELKQAA